MSTNLKTSINNHQAKKIKINSLDSKKLIINFLANIILKKQISYKHKKHNNSIKRQITFNHTSFRILFVKKLFTILSQ